MDNLNVTEQFFVGGVINEILNGIKDNFDGRTDEDDPRFNRHWSEDADGVQFYCLLKSGNEEIGKSAPKRAAILESIRLAIDSNAGGSYILEYSYNVVDNMPAIRFVDWGDLEYDWEGNGYEMNDEGEWVLEEG